MDYKPTRDQLIIKMIEKTDRVTKGGIALPDRFKSPAAEGEVLAVGPGRWNLAGTERVPMEQREGDIVLFLPGAGVELDRDEKTFSMNADSVLAIKREGKR